nr:PREDICTED: ankyrin repeat and SOCS box protein 11-like isoform X4 [Lepisosteus oculatus]
MEDSSILAAFNNIYVTIFALFCFKLLIKICLALLTHFYIVQGNRKEAARIAEEIYGISPGSWADRSPLHDAAFQGRLLTLKTLIAQGFNVNIMTIDRMSPLHDACLGGHVACAKVLLENGANVNSVTVDGITPLYNACCSGSAACVNVLLEYGSIPQPDGQLASPIYEATKRGANVHKGRLQDTPLHAAARKSSAKVVEMLIDYGADVKSRNSEGNRPVEVCAPNTAVERALLLREGPTALTQLCRLCIRQCLGRLRLHKLSSLDLPDRLKEFLLYR